MTDFASHVIDQLNLKDSGANSVGTITYISDGQQVTTALMQYELDFIFKKRQEIKNALQSFEAKAALCKSQAELLGNVERTIEPISCRD
ncbi:hypothetical protein J8Z24_18285 [Pseudoalteromonas sp. SCSIO 43201]|uniref:hypothetical protein n=1 Tax=Pseudoalteromonas sp. SCSIO 43201 TaxID=2822842 RepID=UPI0020757EFD|nr:hypothetical protein [Pseudoalteromonas sp. SCSIO 43201]USD30910.1 hypothetical protein J8Z24_18285 [Pseudoalteromonas sp. SCSIO 43201]